MKTTHKLIGRYAFLLKDYGVNSKEIKDFLEEHKNNEEVIGLVPFVNFIWNNIQKDKNENETSNYLEK